MLRMTNEAGDWIVENRPEFEGLRPVIDDEELDLPTPTRRPRRDTGRPDMMAPETDNVRREGVILEETRMDEYLCAFVAEVAPYLPNELRVLSPERLARSYLDDPHMRRWINWAARDADLEIPAIRPEDMGRR